MGTRITIQTYLIVVHGLQHKDTCKAAKLGERRLFKVALPETARNLYICFWLSGRALDSGQSVSSNPPPCLLFFFFLSSANPKYQVC